VIPKRKPGQATGHLYAFAAQYIQKKPKNNGLFADWLADFGPQNADLEHDPDPRGPR
jgi:hypothetical protein